MNEETLRRAINAIEKREMPLLSWGVTSGTFTESELEDVVGSIDPNADLDELIDELLDRGLLIAKGVAEERYRSRMAETVRLAVTLRQWFHGRDWSTAPSLVSDARFLSRPRVVPRRDRSGAALSSEMASLFGDGWTVNQERAMTATLAGRDVSSFQARAMSRLVQHHAGSRGTVITAGTGSGKTLAFYLPALTRLLATPGPVGVPRIVAIYPRIELLRDQLRTLLQLSGTLTSAGEQAPKIGVLYGAVPRDRRDAAGSRYRGWKPHPDGLTCPILGCLQDGCNGSLVWPAAAGDTEELKCERCGAVLAGDRLSFTRRHLQANPPTVLFTTTEMVNGLLGSSQMRRLLVGDAQRSPEFLLLDEVHTYVGTHGAQVANLLRRWRAEVATPPHVVGLSATLADPAGFFADLTGLSTSSVSVIAPEPHEMKEVGREYFLALRGDPASQTSLLSTTIQTSMLVRRMLDASPTQPSHGAFGSRLFVFVDDLDVVNRLHTQLEDAEGWRPGGVNRRPNGSLATLRSSTGPDVRAREEAGQLWGFAEQIGTLQRPITVSRTTSRDPGVDDADIVVATPSLEVGFDDPNVGAVLQHKAPRDPAQFLQRRGRAGRDPTMRPWTVVVLSDYGRDRLAFQAYEALFDPVVQPTQLPLRNRVILKMQATWWLLDHLGRFSSGTPVLRVIERPWQDNRERQRQIATRLLEVVRDTLTASGVERLAAQLRRALSLQDEDLRSTLWDHPRGLITAVLPTLARRFEAAASTKLPREFVWAGPMSEFLPSSLFSPLQTPEIRLSLPGQGLDDEAEPVSQAMRQFAPGRVSYRYALGGRRERLWVAPPPSHEPVLAIEDFCDGYIDLEPPPNSSIGRLIQPTSLRLAVPPAPVSDSSYGRWTWRSAFWHEGTPFSLDVPEGTPWTSRIAGFKALTHRHRCAQTMWRYAERVDVERNSSTEPPLTQHALSLDGAPAAVGFAMDVDGLVLDVCLPEDVPTGAAITRALRVARMEYLVRTTPSLCVAVPSAFTREWLHQVLLSVLVTESTGHPLPDVLDSLSDGQMRDRMVDAAREVFGATPVGAVSTGGGPPDPGLINDLADVLHDPSVISDLRSAATALWTQVDDSWLPWICDRYLVTIAAAAVDAIQASCPEVDASDLRCEIVVTPTEEGLATGRVHISEDQPGGVGVIEALVDRYVEDPRAFWALVTASLGPSDGERIDRSLRQFLATSAAPPLAEPVARIRTAADLGSLTAAWRALRAELFSLGIDGDQSIISALSTRIVRPGSSGDLETLVAELLTRWDDTEESLGTEVELRVFAYLVASDSDVRRRLNAAVQGHGDQPGWEIGQIVGLLWPRGTRLRSAALQTYSPYAQFEPTERLLFEDITAARGALVDASSTRWRADLDELLRTEGSATVRARTDTIAAGTIRDLLTEPTSVDVLEFHPRVVGITRSSEGLDVLVELREARQ